MRNFLRVLQIIRAAHPDGRGIQKTTVQQGARLSRFLGKQDRGALAGLPARNGNAAATDREPMVSTKTLERF